MPVTLYVAMGTLGHMGRARLHGMQWQLFRMRIVQMSLEVLVGLQRHLPLHLVVRILSEHVHRARRLLRVIEEVYGSTSIPFTTMLLLLIFHGLG